MCRSALAFLIGLMSLVSAAQAMQFLSGSEIETRFGGKTLEGMYATGRRFTEKYLAGGRLEYHEDGQTLSGRWSVTEGTLCTIYDDNPTGGCYRVVQSAHNCFEFYFVSRTEEAAPGPPGAKPDWTARGAVDGQIDACKEGANV